MQTAIYARFSSDRQSETSIEAQERLCRARADALGLHVVAVHADLAISGAVPVERRPGGKALLADALAGRFTVLVIEGLDRLSRDIGEQDRIVKRLEHRGVRLIGVSDGYDTQAAGRKVMRVARGLVNELYLDDLRAKVHRSLAAKAARGRHVAGLSYGYRSVPAGDDRQLEIVPEQADIVREIFRRYAGGESCQRIAAELNRRGVPGPRGHTWSVSALYGSPRKLAGLLSNPLYVGRAYWNRSQWIKDPDTGKRERVERPRHEWQVRDVPELRIVDDLTWQRVRERIGTGVARGAAPKTLFGGMLRCAKCGGTLIAVDARMYGCANRKDRGTAVCTGVRAPREQTDMRLLAAVRYELASTDAIAQVRRDAAAALEALGNGSGERRARLSALGREIDRLTDAVAQMGLSEALRTRLEAAEAERESLSRYVAAELPSVDEVVARYRANLLRVRETLAGDPERARQALAELLGRVTVEAHGEEVWATVTTRPEALLLAANGDAKPDRVAGGGYGTGLRIRLL
jgi:site-specific DNA recombinase